MNTIDSIWEFAADDGAKALLTADGTLTYRELYNAIGAYAAKLQSSGVGSGDRVLISGPTSVEFVVAYHAILALGAVAVTVNPQSTVRELEYFVNDSGATFAIAGGEAAVPAFAVAQAHGLGFRELHHRDIEPTRRYDRTHEEVPDDQDAVLLYTSGTTGKPKGAQLTHGNLVACAASIDEALNIGAGDRFGTALPLFHVFGQVSVMRSAFNAGASLSLQAPFEPRGLLELIARHKLTIVSGVPTMWNAMLHCDSSIGAVDLASIRSANSGGAPLPLDDARAFTRRFGFTPLSGYGLSESGGAGTAGDVAAPEEKWGSAGRPLPGLSLDVRDPSGAPVSAGEVGEIVIGGPTLMKGYWRKPSETEVAIKDGNLQTGDLGFVDAEGFVWIVDRLKDLVIRGGYNVYPTEVEAAIYEHPAVREAAVIGLPDGRVGEEVAAVVSVLETQSLTPQELRVWLESRVSMYKVPRVYHFVEDLPKGNTGKILKRVLDVEQVRREGVVVRKQG